MAENILEMDLTPEGEQLLRETLESWKEEVYANLLEEVEVLKEQKIEELEEANIQYREELKAEFSDKLVKALKEMREEVKAEAVADVLASNPELQVFESIKELIAPTLNEDFVGNVYAEEIQALREENMEIKREMEIEEGARTLADLIAPYSEQTQNILLAVIKEGGPEEVTEQFYELIESMELVEREDYDDEDGEVPGEQDTGPDEYDDDDDDDKKDKKKKKKSKKDDDDDDDDEEEDMDDDDMDEDFDEYNGSYINEDEEEDKQEEKVNPFISRIRELAE